MIIALLVSMLYALVSKQVKRSVFKPRKSPKTMSSNTRIKEFALPMDTGDVYVYLVIPKDIKHKDRFLYFLPGNSYNAGFYETQCRAMADALGIIVCTLDYPGFGQSTGTASRSTINAAASQVLMHVSVALKVPLKNVGLYGFSLGTHVAAWLATSFKDIQLLVLDSCVPVISRAAGKVVQPRFMSPIIQLLLSGYFDIREALKLLSSSVLDGHRQLRIAAVHRSYDDLVSDEEFFEDIMPHCTDSVTVRAGHSWPLLNKQVIKRLAFGLGGTGQ